MKLSALGTRRMAPRNPPSTRAASTDSDTPQVRRVSSTTSTRPVMAASRRMSRVGSGDSQRRSTTRLDTPLSANSPATRRLIGNPLPNVTKVSSGSPSPTGQGRGDPIGRPALRGQPAAVAAGGQTPLVVQRNRLQEPPDGAVLTGRGQQGTQ